MLLKMQTPEKLVWKFMSLNSIEMFIFLCCLVPLFLWNSLRSLSLKIFLPLMKFFGLDWLPGRILANQMMTRQAFLLFFIFIISMIKQIFFQALFFFCVCVVMSLLQKDYEELAATVMTIVDCVVNKTRVFFLLLHIQFCFDDHID